jgi:hypothetical protein
MTNAEILQKARQKAKEKSDAYILSESWLTANYDNISELAKSNNYFSFIFSHDFAKSFWGEYGEHEVIYSSKGLLSGEEFKRESKINLWKYHLQQMVLEEEPLKYLEKFL